MLSLDATNKAFNWANAQALAEASAYVYTGPSLVPAPGEQWIFDRLTDAHALIQARGDAIVICFRGSKDAEDYIQDAKFEMTTLAYEEGDDLPASVHKGFLEDFDALNADIIHALRSAITASPKPLLPIFVTGHSLGGGLAILCALELVRQGFNVAGVYTFGQPRVGNKEFCQLYDSSACPAAAVLKDVTFRVINQNDIVPRVPPLLNGYRHCGNCVFLFSDGWFAPRPPWQMNPSIARRAWSNVLGFWDGLKSWREILVTDHHIGNYEANIAAVAGGAAAPLQVADTTTK